MLFPQKVRSFQKARFLLIPFGTINKCASNLSHHFSLYVSTKISMVTLHLLRSTTFFILTSCLPFITSSSLFFTLTSSFEPPWHHFLPFYLSLNHCGINHRVFKDLDRSGKTLREFFSGRNYFPKFWNRSREKLPLEVKATKTC